MQYIIPTVQLEINKKLPSIPEKRCWQNSPIPRPDLDSIERRQRWSPPPHTHTHIHTRAHKHRMRPCRGFPRSMEGRKETRFEVVPLYADISWEEPVLQKEGRGGALHRARDERTKRGAGGGRAEGGGGGREPVFERSWRKWWLIPHLLTYITLVSPPPSTPTIGRHKLSRYNAAYGTAGRPAGRRCPTSSARPTKWHSHAPPPPLPYSAQPRPRVSFTRQNYVTVARTSRPKFFHSARTWIVR